MVVGKWRLTLLLSWLVLRAIAPAGARAYQADAQPVGSDGAQRARGPSLEIITALNAQIAPHLLSPSHPLTDIPGPPEEIDFGYQLLSGSDEPLRDGCLDANPLPRLQAGQLTEVVIGLAREASASGVATARLYDAAAELFLRAGEPHPGAGTGALFHLHARAARGLSARQGDAAADHLHRARLHPRATAPQGGHRGERRAPIHGRTGRRGGTGVSSAAVAAHVRPGGAERHRGDRGGCQRHPFAHALHGAGRHRGAGGAGARYCGRGGRRQRLGQAPPMGGGCEAAPGRSHSAPAPASSDGGSAAHARRQGRVAGGASSHPEERAGGRVEYGEHTAVGREVKHDAGNARAVLRNGYDRVGQPDSGDVDGCWRLWIYLPYTLDVCLSLLSVAVHTLPLVRDSLSPAPLYFSPARNITAATTPSAADRHPSCTPHGRWRIEFATRGIASGARAGTPQHAGGSAVAGGHRPSHQVSTGGSTAGVLQPRREHGAHRLHRLRYGLHAGGVPAAGSSGTVGAVGVAFPAGLSHTRPLVGCFARQLYQVRRVRRDAAGAARPPTLLQEEMEAAYPSGNVASSQVGEEFQSMDTLYHLPIANVYANLVHYFDDGHVERDENVSAHAAATTAGTNGIAAASLMADDARISYLNLWQDVRAASDIVHERGLLKQRTLERLTEYLSDDDATYRMLRLLRGAGKRLFLLTNSEYWYTSAVMDYMVGRFACPDDPSAGWRHAFDVCIVGAKKPTFFRNGTTLREVDVRTGRPKLDDVRTRHLRLEALRGRVFQGGSIAIFHALAGVARGSSVLYVGDHVYADVLLARKAHHWRTLLVVPELSAEIRALTQAQALLKRLQTLEYLRAEMFRGLDASARERPDRDGVLQAELERVREGIEAAFNRYAGGLFRSAHRTTLFAQQVSFFADLYTERCANLADYPGFYYFSSVSTPQMPHEDQPAMTSERVG
eukprot:ctg_1106.g428